MKKRTHPKIGEDISLLGFGLMRLPVLKEGETAIDYEHAQQMVDYALKNGINYLDTAWGYHEEESQVFIGEAIQQHSRASFNLTTKMPLWLAETPDDIHRIFDEQLKRCQTDYFDFYLLHSMNQARMDHADRLGAYEIMRKKQEEGLIRHFGFSFHDSPAVLKQYVDKYDWDFIQIQLNYMDWQLQDAKTSYQIITDANTPVIVMEPIRGGALATLSEDAVAILKEKHPEDSPAKWALRYVASLPNVLCILSGMSHMDQLVENIETVRDIQPLTEDERLVLDEALAAYSQSGTIPCTGCAYCMDCPFGVDIPKVFRAYNNYRLDENRIQYRGTVNILGDGSAHSCTQCGTCLPLCPQHIDIPEWMERIDGEFEALD